jgi:hypothetical protein
MRRLFDASPYDDNIVPIGVRKIKSCISKVSYNIIAS